LLLLPFLVGIAFAIKLSDPGPALYKQMRVGRGGRRFHCWKFRSMVVDADRILLEHLNSDPCLRREWDESQKLFRDPRVTVVGQFLRRTSLDELPQLWNVLVGDMSLVGPRPIIESEAPRYAGDLCYYLSVRPGLTGLWQVSGRSSCTYSERVSLDVKYAKEWNVWLDIVIIARTIPEVLKQRGV
jgi:exopolysaccharide production protein ExoY